MAPAMNITEVLEMCEKMSGMESLFGGLNPTFAISKLCHLGQVNNPLSMDSSFPQTPCGCCGDSPRPNIFAQSLGHTT